MSSVTGVFDSSTQLLVPALQAAATLTILSKQKDLYDDVADQRIDLIDEAVTKYISGMDALISTGLVGDAFGTVPEAARYQEVDSRDTIYAAINENLQNIPAAERHIAAVNRMNERNDIVRMTAFSPEFLHLAHKESLTISQLMKGQIPVDTLVDLTTSEAETAAAQGRIGVSGRRTNRSIGLTRIEMQNLAAQRWQAHVAIAGQVSPVPRQQTIQEMLGTPQNRIALALTQAQLLQADLQNFLNSESAGDPTKLGELQVELQKLTASLGNEAQRGNLVNQFVPNYSALLQPQINSISEALLGSGDRTGADAGARGGSAIGQSNGQSNGFTNPNNIF